MLAKQQVNNTLLTVLAHRVHSRFFLQLNALYYLLTYLQEPIAANKLSRSYH